MQLLRCSQILNGIFSEMKRPIQNLQRRLSKSMFRFAVVHCFVIASYACLFQLRYYLRPQVLNDVSDVDVSTTILGSEIHFPVCVGPTTLNKIAHADGEVAVARGILFKYWCSPQCYVALDRACYHTLFSASACLNTAYVLGAWSSTSIEEIAKQTGGSLKWMQVYIYKVG